MPRYRIEATGNGAFFTITRLADGAKLFLQGTDAVEFDDDLAVTNDRYTDDDLCSEHDESFEREAV